MHYHHSQSMQVHPSAHQREVPLMLCGTEHCVWTRELQRTSCAVQSEGLLHRWPPRASDQAEGCTLLSSPEPYRPHLSVPQTRLALREGRERRVYSRCLWPGGTAV